VSRTVQDLEFDLDTLRRQLRHEEHVTAGLRLTVTELQHVVSAHEATILQLQAVIENLTSVCEDAVQNPPEHDTQELVLACIRTARAQGASS
jgi:uncharacterized coiled-coil protein SlyX